MYSYRILYVKQCCDTFCITIKNYVVQQGNILCQKLNLYFLSDDFVKLVLLCTPFSKIYFFRR